MLVIEVLFSGKDWEIKQDLLSVWRYWIFV
jgi:hypothetical protein